MCIRERGRIASSDFLGTLGSMKERKRGESPVYGEKRVIIDSNQLGLHSMPIYMPKAFLIQIEIENMNPNLTQTIPDTNSIIIALTQAHVHP